MKEIIASMGVYDYGKNKLCDLYDSQNSIRGQAYNISFKQSMTDGIHELTFTIPYMADGEENFRWAYMRNEYLIRLKYDGKIMWYIATKPVKSKTGGEIVGTVTCQGLEALLKTRNIYMEFDDTNGIGTADELTDRVLAGTGWHRGYTDPMLEADGVTEKVRSITSGGKDGALGLMSKIASVFKCFPVYDSENLTVALYSFNNRNQVLEGTVGGNLNALTVTPDSASMITRMYVEGEYGDNGYVGIDDVNPTGLTYLMNFDYYRDIGVMTPAQETALADYIRDISAINRQIRQNTAAMIAKERDISELIGMCNLTLYYTSTGIGTRAYTWGEPTDAQKALTPGSDVIVLNNNGTYRHATVETTAQALIQSGDYAIAKFGTPASGIIGGKEVQVEAKEKEIENLRGKISRTQKADKIAEYTAEIAGLQAGITELYENATDGLYALMRQVMMHSGLLESLDGLRQTAESLSAQQDDVESDFIIAMGPLLRDGYWSNQNYVPGQEQALYNDAIDVMKEMSRPATSYSFDYVRVVEDFDIPMEDIRLNAVFRINDDELNVHDNLFITTITIGVDDPSNGSIEVSNRDITLNSNDLGALLSRMSQLADLIEQKNTLYDRAKAISKNGTLYTDRLNGQIDVLKIQLLSTVSNWHTDENGNIVFEAADGSGVMMLTGAGFMIANQKDENGEWIFRTFGTPEGFTADEIVAGFLSVDRIEAGSIATSKVTPDFGNSLVITNNPEITGVKESIRLTDEKIDTEVERLDDADKAIGTRITQTVEDITLGNIKAGAVDTQGSTVVIGASGISMKTGATFTVQSNNFKIDQSGNVEMSGKVTAGSGSIGGWKIGSNYIGDGDYRAQSTIGMSNIGGADPTVFWAGYTPKAGDTTIMTGDDPKFYVTKLGNMYASSAHITGEITATGGTIGGWTIVSNANATRLQSGSGANYVGFDSNGAVGYAIWAGAESPTNAPFSVSKAGAIKAKSGTIGGWTITDTTIESGKDAQGHYTANYVALSTDTSNGNIVAIRAGAKLNQQGGMTGAYFTVTRDGSVNAEKGNIGGWQMSTTTPNRLYSGSGTTYVGLSSNTNDAYAIWAGADSPTGNNPAPFRVKRDGTVIIKQLEIAKEDSGTETIDLTNKNSGYPLWKLNGANLKDASVSDGVLTITRFRGDPVTFNSAGSVTVDTSAGGSGFSYASSYASYSDGKTHISVTVALTNGNHPSGSLDITDRDGSGLAFDAGKAYALDHLKASGWKITYNASGATVGVTVGGHYFQNTFND